MKKTGILVLVLVLALGSLGVGYAAWSDLLTVNNTAQLGSLDARFTNAVFEDHDNSTTNDFGTVAVNSGITGNPDVATMTISNAYPGYTATGTFTITNFSTMAVKIDVDEEGNDPNNRFTGAPTYFQQRSARREPHLCGDLRAADRLHPDQRVLRHHLRPPRHPAEHFLISPENEGTG